MQKNSCKLTFIDDILLDFQNENAWNIALSDDKWNKSEYQYPIRIKIPRQDGSEQLLEFRSITYRIKGNKGFVVVYEPDASRDSMEAIFSSWHAFLNARIDDCYNDVDVKESHHYRIDDQEAAHRQSLEAAARRLTEQKGIEFEAMPGDVYPGMPLITPSALLQCEEVKYGLNNILHLVKTRQITGALRLGGNIYLTPEGVEQLFTRQAHSFQGRASAATGESKRAGGRKPSSELRRRRSDQIS